jgi:hypothetical protein
LQSDVFLTCKRSQQKVEYNNRKLVVFLLFVDKIA